MARICTLLLFGALVMGCQPAAVVENLPKPNFNGPVIDTPGAPAPLPGEPAIPTPAPRPGIGGDRTWQPAVAARPWKWIVIHHSATHSGAAAAFDRMHREKGWDELGYHFVIGNGTDSGNGQVEVGSRWLKQKWGAHTKTADNRFNEYGIGICLVGNFDVERPTPRQMQSLARLTAYLMRTYNISSGNILGHRDAKATDCPGRNVNIAQIRRLATQGVADAGEEVSDQTLPQPASAVQTGEAESPE